LTSFAVGAANAAPVAQYTFDNADIIGTSAQGDKIGSNDTSEPLSAVSTGITGKFDQAYRFAGGANNLMTIPAGLVPSGAAERTISIWFNQTADQASLQDKLFGYGAGSAGNAFDLSLEDGGIRLRHFGGTVAWGSGFDFDGTDAGWHHLAVRVNASASTFADVDVFLDGVQLAVTDNSGQGVTINTTDSSFGIGTTSITTSSANTQGFKGSLDELRIYDSALIESEIATLALLDSIPPTLASSDMVDDQSGGPIEVGSRVTYTVTFSEDINDSTVSAADFENAGTSVISFGTITKSTPGVFTVEVTPTTTGTLQLSVPTTAAIEDLAGNALDSDPAILDDTTITVTADSTAPTLVGSDIVDDRVGSAVPVNSLVTYTLTFSEAIDAGTVDMADFANNGTSDITVGTITETSPSVFTVEVTPTTLGTLELRIAGEATITDLAGLALATSPAIVDDTSLTVRERQPNIVIFLVDDMGIHDTSVPFLLNGSGQPTSYNFNNFYQTPNMETLASQGLRFTTAYAQTVCSPTRVGLLTGRTSARHGVTDWVNSDDPGSPTNWRIDGMTESEPTLPKELQSAGYRTIHIGKGHLAKAPVDIKNLGFDVNVAGTQYGRPASYTGNYGQGDILAVPHLEAYHNTGTFLTKALSLEASAQIENAVNAGIPFFLQMSFYAVHSPFTTNPDATGDYSTAVSSDHAKYATMIEGMDIAIGDIRQKLIDLNVAEDTLIIFLGDNGPDSPATTDNGLPLGSFSDWPMRGKKATKWEGGARVPLIATWAVPNANNSLQQALPIPANSIETDIVTTWDIPATLLDFVGLSVPVSFGEDSHSLLPYLAGTPGTHRPQEIAVHYPHEHRSDFFSWIRQGDMKLIYNFQNNTHELYNLAADPTESTNLAASQAATAMALIRRLAQMLDDEWGPYGVMLPTISSSAPAGNVVSIPDDAGIDLDNDGIDDRDEDPNLNGLVDPGETDPDNDNSDNDNITDGGELKLGLDPLDPNSFFYLTGDRQANGSMLVTWPSQPGTSFEIQSSTDLGDWSTLIEANYPADDPGTSTSYTVPASAEPREFYRIGLK
jgi:arylsulfatase A-like enzyme